MFYIWMVSPRHLPPIVLAALVVAPLLLAPVLLATPAQAACTSPPGPEVVWRRCLLDGRDLVGADLSRGHLRDASLQRARLAQAVMVGMDGTEARFVSADLTGADLTDANLREADFTRATLRGARLIRVDLRRASMNRADMTGADLTGANLTGADFSGAILDGVRWTDGQRVCEAGSVGTCQ